MRNHENPLYGDLTLEKLNCNRFDFVDIFLLLFSGGYFRSKVRKARTKFYFQFKPHLTGSTNNGGSEARRDPPQGVIRTARSAMASPDMELDSEPSDLL